MVNGEQVRRGTRLKEGRDIPESLCGPSSQVCPQLQLLKQPNMVSGSLLASPAQACRLLVPPLILTAPSPHSSALSPA